VTSAEIDRLIIDLSKKLGVTSIVVTHEMNSAFAVADRMAMLERGRMLMVDTRQAFEELRDWPKERVDELDDKQQTIRQFLRGDAEGPITRRKAATNYAEDLLGGPGPDDLSGGGPAVESTRSA
jgi:phospholipid/cholesterol/gamma-HCH transport system ATP-binding protein